MDREKICQLAEDLALKYNPEGLSPFPFEKIQKENSDLFIYLTDSLREEISGATFLKKENGIFYVVINKNKSKKRQHFTTAHELGHYFLHKEVIKREETLIDGDGSLDGANILYRADGYNRNEIETEANNFAASLIMPKKLVADAWSEVKDVEKCAEIFNVSVAAMAIRLERLHLI